MSWQLALGIYFIFTVTQALFQRSYSQSHALPESFPPALSYLIGVTPLGLVVGLFMQHHVRWSWWLVLLLAGEGIFIGLYNWLSFRAMRRLPIARFQTIFQLYELMVILLGWTLLGERLNFMQVFGGGLILTAALLAIRAPLKNQKQLSKSAKLSAVALAVLSALVMGIGLVIEKAALGHMDMGAYFIFGYGAQTAALLALAARDVSRQSLKRISSKDYKKSCFMGIQSASIGFFYIIAIVKSDNISLITALAAFSLPLTVLAGYLFLKERDDLKFLLGSVAIGFIGLLISAIH